MKKDIIEAMKDILEMKYEWHAELLARKKALVTPDESAEEGVKIEYEIEYFTIQRGLARVDAEILGIKADIENVTEMKKTNIEDIYKKKGAKHGPKTRSKNHGKCENDW